MGEGAAAEPALGVPGGTKQVKKCAAIVFFFVQSYSHLAYLDCRPAPKDGLDGNTLHPPDAIVYID